MRPAARIGSLLAMKWLLQQCCLCHHKVTLSLRVTAIGDMMEATRRPGRLHRLDDRAFWRDDGSAVRMEGGDRRGPPGLSFCTIRLRPDNRLPIGIEDEVAACSNLDSGASWFMRIEKEALGNGVFAWSKCNPDAVFQVNVRCTQHIFAIIDPVGDMMQSTS